MSLGKWEQKFKEQCRTGESIGGPAPLVVGTAASMKPGRALDLACGSGRNSLWLAEQGWDVTAVDGSPSAIALLKGRARQMGREVKTETVDLENGEFPIATEAWDFILICYFLQRNLFESAKAGLRPGGILLSVALLSEPGHGAHPYTLQFGELKGYFAGWRILHYREGRPGDAGEGRRVAEIVAQRPSYEARCR